MNEAAKDSHKTILIIEDEPAMMRLLADKLSREGFMILDAKDGEEGLNAAFQNHPHLILLDIVLPKMDGMTLMKKLRADAWGKTVPVILLTNLNLNDQILKGVTEDEPAYYLVKTRWTIDDVVTKIKQTLGV